MDLSSKKSFTLIIDEFHKMSVINKSIYGEMKKIWDKKNGASRINLILCGPEYSLMQQVYDHFKKPVLGRVINRLSIKEFATGTIKEILKDNYPAYTPEDLLAFYLFTGGVADYVKILVEKQAFTREAILNQLFTKNSFFLEEGKNILIDEFGKDYGNYFSILSLIATYKMSRPEIESILEMNVGGFLDRMEADLNILTKARPFFAKDGSRLVRYSIRDNFLNFWFRYIYKYMNEIKKGNLLYVRNIAEKDYAEYSNSFLEKYFMKKLEESQQYTHIGTYWEPGNTNKIDIIVNNEFDKKVTFIGVEREKNDAGLSQLKEKSEIFRKKYPEYGADYLILGMEDM
jgi:AAA+ ATPase superfamily predicted ATPase